MSTLAIVIISVLSSFLVGCIIYLIYLKRSYVSVKVFDLTKKIENNNEAKNKTQNDINNRKYNYDSSIASYINFLKRKY